MMPTQDGKAHGFSKHRRAHSGGHWHHEANRSKEHWLAQVVTGPNGLDRELALGS
jgi:hypothetical protein